MLLEELRVVIAAKVESVVAALLLNMMRIGTVKGKELFRCAKIAESAIFFFAVRRDEA